MSEFRLFSRYVNAESICQAPLLEMNSEFPAKSSHLGRIILKDDRSKMLPVKKAINCPEVDQSRVSKSSGVSVPVHM